MIDDDDSKRYNTQRLKNLKFKHQKFSPYSKNFLNFLTLGVLLLLTKNDKRSAAMLRTYEREPTAEYECWFYH
jgi:hypothetical protein